MKGKTQHIALTAVVFMMAFAFSASAQLISPGELTRSHADLSGVNNCTSCHTLGQRGIEPSLCLDCHEPLSARIEQDLGFHATVENDNCATCHKEHFGKKFDAIRFDTTAFEHDDTGFELTGSHTDSDCQSCHTPDLITAEDVLKFKGDNNALDRTFLGLPTACITCHEPEEAHAGQFVDEHQVGQNCDTCHDTKEWEEAPLFDHDEADFILDATVEKEACPNNLAPTSSTTAQLVMGDALAISLLELRNFTAEDFAHFHPGGALGKRMYMRVADLSTQNERPAVDIQALMPEVIIEISSKRLGATAVLENKKLVLKYLPAEGLVGDLKHYHYDVFTIKLRDIPSLPTGTVQFSMDEKGKVKSLKVDIPNPDFYFDEFDFVKEED